VGELSLGCGAPARRLSARVTRCPWIEPATPEHVLQVLVASKLACTGIGWADAEILAACVLARESTRLYTADIALLVVARRLGVAFSG
jgi:hypothetical protein